MTTTTTTKKSNWTPNEKQQGFLKQLGLEEEPQTLLALSKHAGIEFATGCINPLIKKGLVVAEDRTFECDLVLSGTTEVVGHAKKTVKVYSLPTDEE